MRIVDEIFCSNYSFERKNMEEVGENEFILSEIFEIRKK
jgi:hypothetical protein